MARLADVSYLVIGILVAGLAGIAVVLMAFRRQEKLAEQAGEEPSEDWTVSRRLAEADLALFRADLASHGVQLAELRDLGDPLAEELGQDLDDLGVEADQLTRQAASADTPEDVEALAAALSCSRRRLARVTARLAGEPVPASKQPCFFNPNHGPSGTVVAWTTADERSVRVPSCAADAERLRSGASPYSRTVALNGTRVAWWEAGALVRPWARGWFGDLTASFPSLASAQDDVVDSDARAGETASGMEQQAS